MKKIIVIYNRADFDGIFCREIARKFLPEAELIGWDYGDPPPRDNVGADDQLYILDLSVDSLMDHPNLIWIDHHKSAIDKYSEKSIKGYRIDGVAACRLTWQWFQCCDGNWPAPRNSGIATSGVLPLKQDYIEHNVEEPFAVRLAGEYDIWDKRDERAELFQHGLRSQELTGDIWRELLDEKSTIGYAVQVQKLLFSGRGIQYAKTAENASIINAYGFTVAFEGLCFCACNHARFNSQLFSAGLRPEHDACLGFNYDGNGKWRVSLYHAPGKEHHDLSLIAVKYCGGGHRGACGFTSDKLPFL